MSQAGFITPEGTPSVPTSFVTDSGTAVPAANVLNVVTTGAGLQGISTSGAGNTVTITLTQTKITGTGTTVGATTTDLVTVNLGATPAVYTCDGSVSGFADSTHGGPLGAGYTVTGAVRTDGASATIIGTPVIDPFEEGALTAASLSFIASGNNVIVRATGVAGTTIRWKAEAEYIFVV